MIPDSPCAVLEDTLAVRIFRKGKLMCWKHGDEDWNASDDPNCQYHYLIAYKGQFYVVDRFGIVLWIDPSFKSCSSGDNNVGDRKHLMESGRDLYVVDQYFDERRLCRNQPDNAKDTAGFKVYRLNQEWGNWDEIRNLGEVALFLGDYSCFSVSVKEFGELKGNCIYFTDCTDGRVQVFDMADHSIKRALCSPDQVRILWPPLPAWIAPNGFILSPYSRKELIF